MIITFMRSSSYNCYDICPQQYFLNYVLGIPNIVGKRAEIGTIVHKTLEGLAKAKKSIQDKEYSFNDDIFGTIKCNKKKLNTDRFTRQLLDASFDFFSDPQNTTHSFTEDDRKECLDYVHEVFEQGDFDPRKRDIHSVEGYFEVPINEKWASYNYGNSLKGQLILKGTIDLITKIDDNTLEIVDWKTGQRKNWATGKQKTFADLSNDPQLRMYHLASIIKNPEFDNVIVTIYWIKNGGPFTLAYGPNDIPDTLKIIRRRFEEIRRVSIPRLKSKAGTHWFCKRVCHYGKSLWKDDLEGRTICSFIRDKTVQIGTDEVMSRYTQPGFQVGYYENPGE